MEDLDIISIQHIETHVFYQLKNSKIRQLIQTLEIDKMLNCLESKSNV